MRRQTRGAVLACALLGAALAGGCGGRARPFGEVEGTVRLGDRPLANVLVQFLPDPSRGSSGPTSEAITDDQGRYRLCSSPVGKKAGRDGAAVGWHSVVLVDLSASGTPQGKPPPPARVPERYSLPGTTPLKFEVKEGSQTIDIDVGRR
jgi:hypothetical protein